MVDPAFDPPLDQAGALEDLEVLGDRRQRDPKRPCQAGHRLFAPGEPSDDRTAGGIRQGAEDPIEPDRDIINHTVNYILSASGVNSGGTGGRPGDILGTGRTIGLGFDSAFALYFRLGIGHILDWRAADHLLFLVALVIPYGWRDWRRLLGLVTGFTVGHSLTLAAATLGSIPAGGGWVEIGIAITILATAAVAMRAEWARRADLARPGGVGRYLLAIVFGLVHGLGFSSYLRSLLGDEESIVAPLLWFNLGLEAAQLIAVTAVIAVSSLVSDRLVAGRRLRLAVSGAIVASSLVMIVRRVGIG